VSTPRLSLPEAKAALAEALLMLLLVLVVVVPGSLLSALPVLPALQRL
jgi:hypothetical protein